MITFEYLTGIGRFLVNLDILSFLNEISDELSLWGSSQSRYDVNILADFDGTIGVRGERLKDLVELCKGFQEFAGIGLPLPSKQKLRRWNELIFDLYSSDSIVVVLTTGEVRGSGLMCEPGQRLYGGHLIINRLGILFSASFTSIDIQSQLLQDIALGLQAFLAITSNLENIGFEDEWAWRLTLRPGMLYEEIFDGRNS